MILILDSGIRFHCGCLVFYIEERGEIEGEIEVEIEVEVEV